MDRTAFIVVSICVFLLYYTWPSPPSPSQQPNSRNNTNEPSINSSQTVTNKNTVLTVRGDSPPPVELESEKLVTLETENSIFTFTSAGGLKSIGLTNYKADPRHDKAN